MIPGGIPAGVPPGADARSAPVAANAGRAGPSATPTSLLSTGQAGAWPMLQAGQTVAALPIRPPGDGAAAAGVPPTALAVRVIALDTLGPTLGPGAVLASPAAVAATIVAVGADGRPIIAVAGDGRPIIAAGDALLRLNAATALPAGARLVIAADARVHAQAPPRRSPLASQRESLGASLGAAVEPMSGNGEAGWRRLAGALAALFAPLATAVQAWRPRAAARPAPVMVASGEVARPDGADRPVDVLAGGGVGPVSLRLVIAYDHEPPAGAGVAARPKGFVLSLRLSRLGRVELDARLDTAARRCDLVVRSETPLPPEARAELRTVFAAAGEVAGLGGVLGFAPVTGSPPATVPAADRVATAGR